MQEGQIAPAVAVEVAWAPGAEVGRREALRCREGPIAPAEEQAQVRNSLSTGLKVVVAQNLFKRIDKRGRCAALEILVCTAAVGNLTGAAFVNLLLTAVGANNFTTRTATQMFGDIPGAYTGLKYMASIRNTNAGTTTLVAGTGVTLTGTMTIAQNTTRLFMVEFTSPTACTITSLGVTATL